LVALAPFLAGVAFFPYFPLAGAPFAPFSPALAFLLAFGSFVVVAGCAAAAERAVSVASTSAFGVIHLRFSLTQ
jgi:hypothetical protein